MLNNKKERKGMIDDKPIEYAPVDNIKIYEQLDKMTEAELLRLRAKVDALLPMTQLSDVNLERELMLQFRVAQNLQTDITNDREIPANQKAQVMNSVASTLQSLVKMQIEYYTPERLKRIELILIDMLNKMPEDQTREFFEKYERLLRDT